MRFLSQKRIPRVGGHYRVNIRMLDETEHEARGEFLELDILHHVVMTFRWMGEEDDHGTSRLEITLRASGAHTELTFVHADLHIEETRWSHEQVCNGALDKLERFHSKAD